MISFKSFLLNEEEHKARTQQISIESAKKILKTSCTEFLMANISPCIYRGIDQEMTFGFVEPSKYKRSSANTSNHYTLLVDNSPSWKFFPKRSQSIICSTNIYRASEFGIPYIIIPFDGARHGVCSSGDFWDSFHHLKQVVGADLNMTMEDFNWQLENFYQFYMKSLKGSKSALPDDSWESMKGELVDLVNLIKDKKPTESPRSPLGKYLFSQLADNKSIILTLQELLDPKLNKFVLANNNSIAEVRNDKEVWTNSPCILLDPSAYEEELSGEEIESDSDYDNYKTVYARLRKEILGK